MANINRSDLLEMIIAAAKKYHSSRNVATAESFILYALARSEGRMFSR